MSKIQLPEIFQDHMILQREKPVRVCGSVSEGKTVLVVLGGDQVEADVVSGKFSCLLPARKADRDLTMSFFVDGSRQPELTIRDISVGDIWIASGQSNMEYFMRYDAEWNQTQLLPKNADIRMFNVPRICYEGQELPTKDFGYWFRDDDMTAWPLFSAPGYYFAREIQEELDIPVGIIGCNWGGTPACAWMGEEWQKEAPLDVYMKEYDEAVASVDPEVLKQESLEYWKISNSYTNQLEWMTMMYGLTYEEQERWIEEHQGGPVLPMGPYHHYRPAGLYHTMIETFAPFAVKGVLWYQGESDCSHPTIYDKAMTALIDCFRKTFEDPELPFLYVQLAPFGRWLGFTGIHTTEVRECQTIVAHTVPQTAMVCTMDIGAREDIHPKFKKEVGRRLALAAKGHVYGLTGTFDSPEYLCGSRSGDKLMLQFAYTGSGLTMRDAKKAAAAFKVTQNGEEKEINGIQASGYSIVLNIADLSEAPVEVSFAEEDYCEVAIWNDNNLPVFPFHCSLSL